MSASYAVAADPDLMPGFVPFQIEAAGVRFAGVAGGTGSPLLLLHGWPQTHVAWRKVAPALARRFTLIVPDLPGYGASRVTDGPRWTKRRVGRALVALMHALGHQRFALAGHDRGARAGYRLVLDHPGVVTRFAALAVLPTLDALAAMDFVAARKAFHWFMLAQPEGVPETMLASAPDIFLNHVLDAMGGLEGQVIDPAAKAAYLKAFRDPCVRHAMCEDYRAGLDEDLELDRSDRSANRKLDCPVAVLWSAENGGLDIATQTWRRWASDVTGVEIGGGHLQPEERPQQVASALMSFFLASESAC